MNTSRIRAVPYWISWSSRIRILFQSSIFQTSILVAVAGIFGFTMANAEIVNLPRVMQGFQWGVLIIYFSMDRFTSLVTETGIMQGAAIRLAKLSQGRRRSVMYLFAGLLFLVSAFLNNLTAVHVVLPILFVLLSAVMLDHFFVVGLFSLLLAISNLGGAATPIGDFPAIIIMKSGLVAFKDYLFRAFPLFATTAMIITAIHLKWIIGNPYNKEDKLPSIERRLGTEFLCMQYRHRKVRRSELAILGIIFCTMFMGWSWLSADRFPPELVAIIGLGCAAVLIFPKGITLDLIYDMEPMIRLASFLFIAALAKDSGILGVFAEKLQWHIREPLLLLCSIMGLTALLSGLLSAGPAAAAMMPVIQYLAEGPLQPHQRWLAIGFAGSICAGSSLFLWSATAGFLLLDRVHKANLKDKDGKRLSWGVGNYFKYGLFHFVIQLLVTVVWVVLGIKLAL